MCCIYMYIYKIHVHQKVMERYMLIIIYYISLYIDVSVHSLVFYPCISPGSSCMKEGCMSL